MKKYDWILFDADETLFDYDSYRGLTRVLAQYGLPLSRDDYVAFQAINMPLWTAYQNGDIDMQQLAEQRFAHWAQQTGQPALALNMQLQWAMARISKPLAGVHELLQKVQAACIKIGIITNGFAALQQPRLQHTMTEQYIDLLIVSETEGYPKPDSRLFASALHKMGQPAPERVLMVGDNLHTDILGGLRAGMDTCWLNAHGKARVDDIVPTYEIGNMQELQNILSI